MKKNTRRLLLSGTVFLGLFIIWTILIRTVDVKPVGQNGTCIGFSEFNTWFHNLTGVNMAVYTVTDWLGLVPCFICTVFAALGLCQLIKRRSLLKVDSDILILGIYYILIIIGYLAFEIIPVNYRPVPIDGVMETSYPSSTTLLVLSVMSAFIEQLNRRLNNPSIKIIAALITVIFMCFMIFGRLISGVHWFTDIVGSVFLSAGLFCFYKAFVLMCGSKTDRRK